MKINCWFLLERAEDLPDTWSVHCLELDVITFGDSLEEGLRMGLEAAQMTLRADLAAGLDTRRRRAPEEYWQKLYALMAAPARRHLPVNLLNASEREVRIVAANLEVSVPGAESSQATLDAPVGGILAA